MMNLGDILDELRTQNASMAADSGNLLVKTKARGLQLSPVVQARLLADARKAYGDCVIRPDVETMAPSQADVLAQDAALLRADKSARAVFAIRAGQDPADTYSILAGLPLAIELAAGLGGERQPELAPAVAALAGWSAAHQNKARRRLRKDWDNFRGSC